MTNVKKVRIYACPFGYPSPTCGHVIVDECVAQNFCNQGQIEQNSTGQFWTRLKRSELKKLVTPHRPKPLQRLTDKEYFALITVIGIMRDHKDFAEKEYNTVRDYILRQKR